MSAVTLQKALQFGGTERFGDRTGLGRFGMGLPNSSVSQTKRLDVFTWRSDQPNIHTYLDVDEVASGKLHAIPAPRPMALPQWVSAEADRSGTLVLWTECDRLGHLRAATVAQRLRGPLGRIYRFAIWQGVEIRVNQVSLTAVDPLFCDTRTSLHGAIPYGIPLTYERKTPRDGTAVVEVRFSELPVADWHSYSISEKRRMGIIGGAGVSVVRAGREIDYGWYLMGGKRRENYDDWWRCEIRFEPQLDEFFGVTHSKQGINPTLHVRNILGPGLEPIARTLNARVRASFEAAKATRPSAAVAVASTTDQFLPAPKLRRAGSGNIRGLAYRIKHQPFTGPEFYRTHLSDGTITLTLNQSHLFFENGICPGMS